MSLLIAGQEFEGRYVISHKELIPFRNSEKGSFLSLTLVNKDGQIEARKWEDVHGHELLSPGSIISVRATVEDFNGSLQLHISEYLRLSEKDLDLTEFLPASPRDQREMEAELDQAIEAIPDTDIRVFMGDWFADTAFRRRYTVAPAAKQIHHARIGGLLEHSLEVVRVSLVLADIYHADKSMVTAGAVLHDVGKTLEYNWLPFINMSDRGKLLGHIALGYELVNQWGQGLPEQKRLHLGHIILSHHGEMEYGSPVRPLTLEAAIVHQADLASGRVRPVADALAKAGGEDWTPYDRWLGRSIYSGFQIDDKD